MNKQTDEEKQVSRLVAKGMTEPDAHRIMALLTETGGMTGYADNDTDLAYEYHCRLCDEDFFTHAEISEIADWGERMRELIAS